MTPGDPLGLAWVELSTGRFVAAAIARRQLADQLARIHPAECLVAENGEPLAPNLSEEMMVTRRPDWAYSATAAEESLAKHFGTAGLEGFGFDSSDGDRLAIQAAGAILDYLGETQRGSLDHIDRLVPHRAATTLQIDEATWRSLEVTQTLREGRREGSLLAVMDRTVTAMGSRLLADWLSNPLTDVHAINDRLEAVDELLAEPSMAAELREALRKVYDVQRLLVRVATGRASPRDLEFLGRTLRGLPVVKAKLAARKSRLLNLLEGEIDLCAELRAKLEAALADDCPLASREGGFIREGYSAELDSLRELAHGGKQWIARYQAHETERTGIANLKVGFNKVFGYYLEVTNVHRDKVPGSYIRKQTVKNAERYITPELKEYEEKVLTADEKAKELEYTLFLDLRDAVAAQRRRLQSTADALSRIDVLTSLAELARQRNYCRPQVVEEPVLEILDGRHPVLDVTEPEGTFVPNDTRLRTRGDELATGERPDERGQQHAAKPAGCRRRDNLPPDSPTPDSPLLASPGAIQLITGPNMSGKSTYIRQVALLTLMAQVGSFVPARRATIGIADRIFARVGATDELARGQSTFMVEMTEAARILNTATPRSLVILDEIGRGTSTYDGISLAWAMVEYLHEHVGCRTLFATHYHELTDLEQSLSGVTNLNVAVREWQDEVVFLHKIVDGAADKSYGIHVARLAGVPRVVLDRSKDILAELENEHLDAEGRAKIARRTTKSSGGAIQLTLFGPADHPLLDEIRGVDLNQTTPLDAQRLVEQWQTTLANEKKRDRR